MITIAANTCDLALEEADPLASLESHLAHISVIYLADSGDSLPGAGSLPFSRIGAALRKRNYPGWLVLNRRPSGDATERRDELAACLDFLRDCGIG